MKARPCRWRIQIEGAEYGSAALDDFAEKAAVLRWPRSAQSTWQDGDRDALAVERRSVGCRVDADRTSTDDGGPGGAESGDELGGHLELMGPRATRTDDADPGVPLRW